MSSGLQGAWWRITEHCCLTAKGKGPGFVFLWVSLWALAVCPLLRVISAHTLGGVAEKALCGELECSPHVSEGTYES